MHYIGACGSALLVYQSESLQPFVERRVLLAVELACNMVLRKQLDGRKRRLFSVQGSKAQTSVWRDGPCEWLAGLERQRTRPTSLAESQTISDQPGPVRLFHRHWTEQNL